MTPHYIGLATQVKPGSDDIQDIYLDDNGNLALVYDAEAVGQHVRQRIMTYQGEWFLDTTAGVPWLQQILGKRPELVQTLAEAVIKAETLETAGVTGIDSFSISFDRIVRKLAMYDISGSTIYDQSFEV